MGMCCYHRPLISGLIYRLFFLERKPSTRSHVNCSCYFKRLTIVWKTCLFNGFTVYHQWEYILKPTDSSACWHFSVIWLRYSHCEVTPCLPCVREVSASVREQAVMSLSQFPIGSVFYIRELPASKKLEQFICSSNWYLRVFFSVLRVDSTIFPLRCLRKFSSSRLCKTGTPLGTPMSSSISPADDCSWHINIVDAVCC